MQHSITEKSKIRAILSKRYEMTKRNSLCEKTNKQTNKQINEPENNS